MCAADRVSSGCSCLRPSHTELPYRTSFTITQNKFTINLITHYFALWTIFSATDTIMLTAVCNFKLPSLRESTVRAPGEAVSDSISESPSAEANKQPYLGPRHGFDFLEHWSHVIYSGSLVRMVCTFPGICAELWFMYPSRTLFAFAICLFTFMWSYGMRSESLPDLPVLRSGFRVFLIIVLLIGFIHVVLMICSRRGGIIDPRRVSLLNWPASSNPNPLPIAV